ncbi:Uncharacterised protein [Pseudomonas aeruginosa]|nr:Uncharacterised protein [Pseudomonas aeruginosa]
MIVVVVVDRQAASVLAEQLDEGRVAADLLGVPGAADMAVQADHLVGGAHHQVQVVGDHQHTAAVAVAQFADEAVEFGLAGDVDALHRLVEHQQLGLAQQGAGQQHALQFATGNALQRALQHVRRADLAQRRQRLLAPDPGYQAEEAQYAERQGGVDVEFLRHVADGQPRPSPDLADVRLEQAEHAAYQGGLAGAVGADQGDDLAGLDGQVDIAQHRLAVEGHADLGQPHQRVVHPGVLLVPAGAAEADHLDGLAFHGEADAVRSGDDGPADIRLFQLDRGVAGAADEELALVAVLRVVAADECVERGDAVHQAVLLEEVQRAVDGRRRGAAAVGFAEHREDIVGPQRLVALPDQFQHAPP